MRQSVRKLAHDLPKAELHLHIEGTLEPEMTFELAGRNGVHLDYDSPEQLRRAYQFEDLQSFLDIYYAGCSVLVTEQDFYDLTMAYLRRAASENVRHAEIFFDPQTHTERGVPYDAVVEGIHGAFSDARQSMNLTGGLVLCFLRHLSAGAAAATLSEALRNKSKLIGVGLDSSEVGNPPSKFESVFAKARAEGLAAVAHAGEEGPPRYISEALDLLGARRIDHGVRCMENDRLVERLVSEQVPLTVCPLSNVKLRVFEDLRAHNLRAMLERGLRVTINSDDPAYFGGYVEDNYIAAADALDLSLEQLAEIARNSFDASFLDASAKQHHLTEIDRVMSKLSTDS